MNVKFCPDCQEECAPDDLKCPECHFPMSLTLTTSGNRRIVEPDDLDDWNRIVGILKRNGVKMETRSASAILTHGMWWALPMLGVLTLISSIFFGPDLVDRIWEPITAPTPVLDLNKTVEEANGEDPDDGEDPSFLAEAFRVTPEQKQFTQDLNLDLNEYIDKPKATLEQIKANMESVLLEITIRSKKRKGVLLNSSGYLITPLEATTDAWKNEVQTFSENGSIIQKTVFVTPMAGRPGSSQQITSKVNDNQPVELTLLKASLNYETDCPINYEQDLNPNEKVWVGRFVSGRYYLEEAVIVNSQQNADNVLFWVLDSEELGPKDSGAPVFNEYGELSGILLYLNGQNTVLSMLRVREKAPTLYKIVK